MRTSTLLLATLKESPNDAEIVSHQLMLRAGLIRKLSSGLYTWLPLGVRVLHKVQQIIRHELNQSDAQEVLMPVVQPAELWHESGRWEKYDAELLRIKDRHQRDFCLGPTHEEVITDLVRNNVQSYKQLPINLYQIQTKFRDEIRPRFGVMRSREFIMKDAYSFHLDESSLVQTYEKMYQCYSRIFNRLGLKFKAVKADTGSIGGNASHEFHVLAESGEDDIVFSDQSDYAANIELAEAIALKTDNLPPMPNIEAIETIGYKSIEEVCQFLSIKPEQCIKTLIVRASEDCEQDLIALALRGDHELNRIKAEKIDAVAVPLEMASDAEITQVLGCAPGSLGPLNLPIPLWVDNSAATCKHFVCGANKEDLHLKGVNWPDDIQIADLRNLQQGDPSPDGQGKVEIKKGIEVGHIFQLGKTYSEKLNANVLNEEGKSETLTMGCYGIGVTRVVAAAIEQNHDERGIIWPQSISPFQLAIVPMNMYKSIRTAEFSEQLYAKLLNQNIEVLFDDRKERPGIMFADMELIGIPYFLIIGEKNLDKGQVELKIRADRSTRYIELDKLDEEINTFLQ